MTETTQIKPAGKRGGRRAGAGRRPHRSGAPGVDPLSFLRSVLVDTTAPTSVRAKAAVEILKAEAMERERREVPMHGGARAINGRLTSS